MAETTVTHQFTSRIPYMVRALYEWLVDNDQTPYICVNAGYPNAGVPMEIVKDGKATLNLSHRATRGLNFGDDYLSFACRLGGKHTDLMIPYDALVAIYGVETGAGQLFSDSDRGAVPTATSTEVAPATPSSVKKPDTTGVKKPSHLSVVRNT